MITVTIYAAIGLMTVEPLILPEPANLTIQDSGTRDREPTIRERLAGIKAEMEERAREKVREKIERTTGVKIDRREEDRRVGEMVEQDMQARWSRANSRCKGLKGRERAACNHELNAEKREWMAMKKEQASQHSPEWTDHNSHDPGQTSHPGRGKGKGKGKKKGSGNQ